MKSISLVLLLAFPSQALAEGMKHIPAWTMVDGKACYEFQDAKKLLVLDADLDALLDKDLIWAQLAKDLQDHAKQLQIALTAEKSANATLKTNSDRLNAELTAETARANKEATKPGMWPAWAIAGSIGLGVGVVAGILLGVYVAKK